MEDSWNGEVKKDAPSASVHQSDEEGLPDSWAFAKPGNTKEKGAFSVAHQCRIHENEKLLEIGGKATKRRMNPYSLSHKL